VTIEEIDFVYDGVPHSLRFHWLLHGRTRPRHRHALRV
jgi:hypothetical protein